MNTKNSTECPTNCPFLGMRSFLPNTLPFYCEKYETYLGMTPAKHVTRCHLCRGVSPNVQQQGLDLLEAHSFRTNDLKKAFLQMHPVDQQKLVHILAQTGIQVQWPKNKKPSPISLLAEAMRLGYEKKKREQSAEVQDFLKLLDVISTGGTPLNDASKSLLSNLFQVLDNSEKGMLLTVLEKPDKAKNFLDLFLKLPHDQSLLKNFRMLLYDASTHQQEKETGNRMLIQEKGKALNMEQHLRLQHLMHLMTQARSHKQRTRD